LLNLSPYRLLLFPDHLLINGNLLGIDGVLPGETSTPP
jgi:hypothetical protein